MRAALALALTLACAAPAQAFELQEADYALLKAINQAHHPVADAAMIGLSNELQTAAVPVLAAYGIAGGWQAPVRAAGAEVAALGLATGLKWTVSRPRPYVTHPDLRTPRGPEATASFPSGHAAVSFAGATAIAQLAPQWAVPAYGWAAAVCYSRMYLGVHYPSDVLAGAAVGVGAAALAGWAFDRWGVAGPQPPMITLPVGFSAAF